MTVIVTRSGKGSPLTNVELDANFTNLNTDKAAAGANTDITSLGAVTSINGGQLAGLRNRIINGNFAINQRAVSGTVVLAAGIYGHDRFKAGASGCTYTFATSANVTTLTISAGSLQQVIEGVNLETGTYALSWAGTATGKIGAGAYSASGVTGAITGGTNTTVEFSTGTLAKVQLEIGSATAFEQRPIGMELALCQRYYCNNFIGAYGSFYTATEVSVSIRLPVPMRAAPTMSLSSGTSLSVDVIGVVFSSLASPGYNVQSNQNISFNGTMANSAAIGMPVELKSNNLQTSAEL